MLNMYNAFFRTEIDKKEKTDILKLFLLFLDFEIFGTK